jgi:hypothetical protein
LPKHRNLKFKLQSDIPEPFRVYWRVVNTGAEARDADGLRGQLEEDRGLKSKDESTLFRGVHSIEAIAVKDNRVVAHDIMYVRIR